MTPDQAASHPFHGPIVVRVQSAVIAVGRGLALTIPSVNEAGTEAAASTNIGVVGAGQPEYKVDITFDRSFALAIRDERDGSLLFIGCVSRP